MFNQTQPQQASHSHKEQYHLLALLLGFLVTVFTVNHITKQPPSPSTSQGCYIQSNSGLVYSLQPLANLRSMSTEMVWAHWYCPPPLLILGLNTWPLTRHTSPFQSEALIGSTVDHLHNSLAFDHCWFAMLWLVWNALPPPPPSFQFPVNLTFACC